MARLPQGVLRRKDGTLQKRFTIDGKRYSIYGHTVAELTEKELAKRKDIESGLYKNNVNVTLDIYFEEFIKQREKYVKPNTIYKYKTIYKNHISPVLGRRKVRQIEKREIQKLQTDMSKKNSIGLCNEVLKQIKTILSSALADEIVIKNVAEGVKLLKDTKREKAVDNIHRALTEQEQQLFMNQAKESNCYYYELFAFMLCTGMRFGEVSALTWRDIDLSNKVIHVNKTQSKGADGKQITSTPKTITSVRDIPMNNTIIEVLGQQKKKTKLVYSDKPIDINQRVFPSPYGYVPFNRQVIDCIEIILAELEEKGHHIERFTTHCFRDTFATRYIEQGGSPQTLKTILGHRSLQMTMDLYAHVLPNTKAEEMNRLNIVI